MTNLPRVLRLGHVGTDVEGAKRTVARYLGGHRLLDLMSQPVGVRRTFGPFFRRDVDRVRGRMGLAKTGRVDQQMWHLLEQAHAPDSLALFEIGVWRTKHLPPTPPGRKEYPKLHHSLWDLYDISVAWGFTDAGTYNPHSLLPSGQPSDHAVWPAYAFDAGFTPPTGMSHTKARQFFDLCVGHPCVEYVILGNKIWSREKGLHNYSAGGHAGHIHVSGRR